MGEVDAMKIFRRGQASIEFALILPIFAMLLFALVYVGFLFIDVVTLDSAAAAAARNAAANNGTVNSTLENKIKNETKLFLYWYEMDAASPKVSTDADGIVTAMIQVKLTGKAAENKILKMFLPPAYTVVKSAYKE